MAGIDALQFDDRFVRTLPGDPKLDNRPRQVLGAAYTPTTPTPVPAPTLVALVPEVAALLGLDATPGAGLVDVLAGNRVVTGMAPYAACYGGHQFGTWAGQLGDGRAITLGEVVGAGGETFELQLKGAGPTPYSRRADGRAVLRSSVRELVCSEAMHHLGVPTTRALSLVTTGAPVLRDLLYDGHPAEEPGAIVCRVAPSFLRFGSYEIHTARDDHATLRRLVRFTLERWFPRCIAGDALDVPAFFAEVASTTAWMVAEWLRVGFVHGVMNTDNMSILGLTIDYGPYGWLEPFDPDWTPNITDASGRRYRFGNQAQVAHWNIAQLARALVPLVEPAGVAAMQATLEAFPRVLAAHHRHTSLRKLGLHAAHASDDAILEGMSDVLGASGVELDMTLFFRALAEPLAGVGPIRRAYYGDPPHAHLVQLDAWLAAYAARVRAEGIDDAERARRMNAVNPLYVPRNYLVQEVIEATERGDGGAALAVLMDVLRQPYTEQAGRAHFAGKRPEWARDKPGCSMLSCSS